MSADGLASIAGIDEFRSSASGDKSAWLINAECAGRALAVADPDAAIDRSLPSVEPDTALPEIVGSGEADTGAIWVGMTARLRWEPRECLRILLFEPDPNRDKTISVPRHQGG